MFTLGHGKLRTRNRKRLGLTVDLPELLDQVGWLRDHQALPGLPRVYLVGDGDLRFDHYVAVFAQGLDVPLYGGLVPHDVVDVGVEDYRSRRSEDGGGQQVRTQAVGGLPDHVRRGWQDHEHLAPPGELYVPRSLLHGRSLVQEDLIADQGDGRGWQQGGRGGGHDHPDLPG